MTKKKQYQEQPEIIKNFDDEPKVHYGNSINKQIGSEIKRIRNKKRITLEQLGAIIGTNKSNISMLENGKKNPSIEFLEKVAIALDKELSISFKSKNKATI